jgi:hypothetical protein
VVCGSAHAGGEKTNVIAPAVTVAKHTNLSILNFFQILTKKFKSCC